MISNLNDLKPGALVEFTGIAPGNVVELWEKVTDASGENVVRARAWIIHQNGNESYHTYRNDGRSHWTAEYDIVSITIPEADDLPDLHLNLKGEYFDEIKAGLKTEEYRQINEHWRKRLLGRMYRHVIVKRGYPKAGDTERTLICKWNGWESKKITHPHFGDEPVNVFAIDVSEKIGDTQ